MQRLRHAAGETSLRRDHHKRVPSAFPALMKAEAVAERQGGSTTCRGIEPCHADIPKVSLV